MLYLQKLRARFMRNRFPLFATRSRLRLILPGVVAMGFTLEGLESTIITTAIPTMARSLHTTPLLMNLSVTT